MANRIIFIVSCLLLLVSLPILWMQGREVYLGSRAYNRYETQEIVAREADLDGSKVLISPNLIEVAGRRYVRWRDSDVALVRLSDKHLDRTALIAAERVGDAFNQDSWRYRFLGISNGGARVDEEFGFRERGKALYRVVIARYVSPHEIGFRNESLSYLPTLLYPIIFPWVTTALGCILLLAGLWRRAHVNSNA